MATPQDEDEMNGVLEQALIVIDEREFERSLRDPRVRALPKSGAELHADVRSSDVVRLRSTFAATAPDRGSRGG